MHLFILWENQDLQDQLGLLEAFNIFMDYLLLVHRQLQAIVGFTQELDWNLQKFRDNGSKFIGIKKDKSINSRELITIGEYKWQQFSFQRTTAVG
jgi:hypothetical protein